MADNALARKLKLKAGMRAAVIGAPEGYLAELEPLPQGLSLAFSLRPCRPGEPKQKAR